MNYNLLRKITLSIIVTFGWGGGRHLPNNKRFQES